MSLLINQAFAVLVLKPTGTIIYIDDESEYRLYDSSANTLILGATNDTGKSFGVIYAGQKINAQDKDPATVKIEVTETTTSIKKLIIAGKLDGSHVKDNQNNINDAHLSALTISSTKTYAEGLAAPTEFIIEDGIIIESTASLIASSKNMETIPGGKAALKISQQLLNTNIDNQGTIIGHGNYGMGLSVIGPLNFINGTLTNSGKIQGDHYAIYSRLLNPQTTNLNRKFKLINEKNGEIKGNVKLCGNNCSIINHGSITNGIMEIEYATVTITNNKIIKLSSISKEKSSLAAMVNNATIDVNKNVIISSLNNNQKAYFHTNALLAIEKTSSNSGLLNLSSLITNATLTNKSFGVMNVANLNSCIINNESTLTVLNSIEGTTTIIGDLNIVGDIKQKAILTLNNINCVSYTMTNNGIMHVKDTLKLKLFTNKNSINAKILDLDSKLDLNVKPKNINTFINNLGASAIFSIIKNSYIENAGTITIQNKITDTVQIDGSLVIENDLEQLGNLKVGYITGGTLINSATITMQTGGYVKKITNKPNAYLYSDGKLTIDGLFKNYGNVNILNLHCKKTVINYSDMICHRVEDTKINNMGTLKLISGLSGKVTITGNVIIDSTLTNEGDIKIEKGNITGKYLINLGSVTAENITLDMLDNKNKIKISDTLKLKNKSFNSGELLSTHILCDSALLTNNTNGSIYIDQLINTNINNTSDKSKSLVINESIEGDVEIQGLITVGDTFTQSANLKVDKIDGNFLNNEGTINVAKEVTVSKLNNNINKKIIIKNKLTILEVATNSGEITTYDFQNKGKLYNSGIFKIATHNNIILDSGITNEGTIIAVNIITSGTLTNNGILCIDNLNSSSGEKDNIIYGTNTNIMPEIQIKSSINGNFIIKQNILFTGSVKISGNLTANRITSTDDNAVVSITKGRSVNIAENAVFGALNNSSTLTVGGLLTLHKQSINSGYLQVKTLITNSTLTNNEGGRALFETIKDSNINTTAKNSSVEIYKAIEGNNINFLGTAYLKDDVTQSGYLNINKIEGEKYGLTINQQGFITADDIKVNKINNYGTLNVNNKLTIYAESTNTGKITVTVFNCDATLNNNKGATIICNELKKATAINNNNYATIQVNNKITGNTKINGCLKINNSVTQIKGVNLSVDLLSAATKKETYFTIEKGSNTEIKQAIIEPSMNIINDGDLKLASGSVISSYDSQDGQLHITIPKDLQFHNTPIFTTRGSFSCNMNSEKAAIIISTDKKPSLSEIEVPTNVTIIRAANIDTKKGVSHLNSVDAIHSKKIKTTSVLLFISETKLIVDKNEELIAQIMWMDAHKITQMPDVAISVSKMAKIMQSFTENQVRNASLAQLQHEIEQDKFRLDSKYLIDHLLSSHKGNEDDIEKHIQHIKKTFFVHAKSFATNPKKLFKNLEEYDDYKQYKEGMPVSPLLPDNFSQLIEQIIVDNSDIAHIVCSENLDNFTAGVDNRLLTSRMPYKAHRKYKNINLTSDIYETSTWSNFSMCYYRNKINNGYTINNYNTNTANFGVDKKFSNLQLGWIFGYSTTKATGLGTGILKNSLLKIDYDIKSTISGIYTNHKFESSWLKFICILGQSEQKKTHSILSEEYNSAYSANLLAVASEFIYSSNFDKLYFEISSKFAVHRVVIPKHSMRNSIIITLPTIKATTRYRSVLHNINFGTSMTTAYGINVSEDTIIRAITSLSYTHTFNLQKDGMQELEFFRKLFSIEHNQKSKHNLHLDMLIQVAINKIFNFHLGCGFTLKDYSKNFDFNMGINYSF